MATVDNRIVQLEFKNADFQKAMKETTEAIKILNESLKTVGEQSGFSKVGEDSASAASKIVDFGKRAATALLPIGKSSEEATKKLQGISSGADFGKITDAAAKVSLAPIGAAADKVTARFSAMQAVALAALATITSRAVDAGLSVTKSLSLDQVTAGFQEYELKLGSIQTIMAGTGESLETVNGYLDELNGYADRTIYSFADMTQNIGKFTNAGVSLDTSVASIQGVAQVAALSGANTNEASRAMYNFAQALSKGYVQLIDWKSIELANMGTVEFKTQLVEAAEAMGTLTKEGDKWVTEAGSEIGPKMQGFNDALTDQFLTTDVLTTTLAKYSDETTELGRRAFAASSDIKTLTQLFDVLQESIGSGFARSFEILIGDFDQAKSLFTSIGDVVVGFVDRTSEARNKMLQLFSDMGGRQTVLWAFRDAFRAIGHILEPIGRAFREVFPKKTAQDWVALADSFRNLVGAMEPSAKTMTNLHRIFKGLFSAMKIGGTIIRALFDAFSDFLSGLGFGKGNLLELAAGFGDFFTELESGLVAGEGVKKLFESLDLRSATGKIRAAAGSVAEFFTKMWNTVKDIGNKLKDFLSNFGQQLADAIDPTGFSAGGETVAVALLAAIAAGLAKVIKSGGFDFDFGGGIVSGFGEILSEIAGALEALQANLKAGALLKIAGAIAVLAVSLAILAAIDADALTRATAAMVVLFTQLGLVFAAFQAQALGGKDKLGLQFSGLATGLLLISGAILVLSFAMKKVSELNPEEISRGMAGIAGSLTILVVAVNNMNAGGGLVKAGGSMILMAVGLYIMGSAIRKIGELPMDTIGKGLYGIVGALVLIGAAMQIFPAESILSDAAALILIGVALNLIGRAVAQMGKLRGDELGKGLLGIAVALGLIAGAIWLMPPNMIVTAAGILLVALALNAIAAAMNSFAGMTWDEIGKGLYTMAAALVLLGVAMYGMTAGLAGAAAVLIISGALLLLTEALAKLAELSVGEIIASLVTMTAALFILATAAYVLQPVALLLPLIGAGLFLMGAAFAAVGLGALAFAKALQILAEVGLTAIEVVIESVKRIVAALPEILEGVIQAILTFFEGIPTLLEPIGAILLGLLDLIIDLIPKVVEVVVTLVSELLTAIRELFPQFVETGYELILALLQGLRDNINEITTLALEIITEFIDALTEGLPDLVTSLVDLYTTALTSVAEALGETVPTLLPEVGKAFLDGFLAGMEELWPGITKWVKDIPKKILDWIKDGFGIASPSKEMLTIGLDIMTGLFNGVKDGAIAVTNWFIALPGKILGWIGDVSSTLWDKGYSFIQGLARGIGERVLSVASWFRSLPGKVLGWLGSTVRTLWSKGWDLIRGLYDGIYEKASSVIQWFRDLPANIISWVGSLGSVLFDTGKAIINGLWNGMKNVWDSATGWLSNLNPANWFNDINLKKRHAHVNMLPTGQVVMQGLHNGMKKGWDETTSWLKSLDPADELETRKINRAFDEIARQFDSAFSDMDMSPTITPVVDLSQVEEGFGRVRQLASVSPSVSVSRADAISASVNASPDASGESLTSGSGTGDVVFNQTLNSPTALSEAEIYRQTRNLVTLAKDELEIP